MIWLNRIRARAAGMDGRSCYARQRTEPPGNFAYIASYVSEEIKKMTVTSRCNYAGPLGKLIPTRSIPSLLARLLRR
jgi:hypothetical protein